MAPENDLIRLLRAHDEQLKAIPRSLSLDLRTRRRLRLLERAPRRSGGRTAFYMGGALAAGLAALCALVLPRRTHEGRGAAGTSLGEAASSARSEGAHDDTSPPSAGPSG